MYVSYFTDTEVVRDFVHFYKVIKFALHIRYRSFMHVLFNETQLPIRSKRYINNLIDSHDIYEYKIYISAR